MLRLILRSCIVIFFAFCSFAPVFATCPSQVNGSVASALKDCNEIENVSVKAGDYTIEGGVKAKAIAITNRLILAASLAAVGGIVYSAILYSIHFTDEEHIKKAKKTFMYSLIGFGLTLLSFPIVNAIINLVYGLPQ